MAWKVLDLIVDGVINLKDKVISLDVDSNLVFDNKLVIVDLPVVVDTASVSYVPNLKSSKFFEYTLDRDSLIDNPLNQKQGSTGKIILKQDATGAWATTWGSDFVFPEGTPSLNNSPLSFNVFNYTVIDTNKILIEYVSDFI